MKFTSYIKRTLGLTVASVFVATLVASAHAAAIPYQGENTTGTSTPQINVFTGVPSVGTESDFLRGREGAPGTGSFVDPLNSACANGTKFTIRTYIHNSADQSLNASGQGVARDVKVKVALPANTQSNSFKFNGTISSSNAGTKNDAMTLSCGSKTVKLSYVQGSARQFSNIGGVYNLSDSIVTTGTKVGTMSPDGNVQGCWNQRVYVTLVVEVKDVPKEQPPKPEQPKPEQPKPEQPKKPEQPRVVPQQPEVLPVTGPAGVGAMAGLVSGLSSLGYYLVNRRRG